MRSRTIVAFLCLIGLALVGCGSTNKAQTTVARRTTLPLRGVETESAPPATYSLTLSSRATHAGPPNASALATITFNYSSGQLCWKFSKLTNVAAPTKARIFRSLPGNPGLPLGSTYKSAGCVLEPKLLMQLIAAHPNEWYVGIKNSQFPVAAVRARL